MTTKLEIYKSTDEKLEYTHVSMWNFKRSYPCYHFKGDYWNGFINPLVNHQTLLAIIAELQAIHSNNDTDEDLDELLEDYFDPNTPSLIIDNQIYYHVGGGLVWEEMEWFENWDDMEDNFYDSIQFVKTSESHMSHLEAEYMIHYLGGSVWIAKMHGGEYYTCCEKEEFQSESLNEVEQFLLEHWVQFEYLDPKHHKEIEEA
jgi:hypothetical protein